MSGINRVLLALLIPAFAAALVLEKPWQGDSTAQSQARNLPLFPLLADAPLFVDRIHLQSGSVKCNLLRRGDSFFVEESFGHPADEIRLQKLLSSLQRLKSGDAVSAGGEHDAVYGLEPEAGTRVQVYGTGNVLLADLQCGALRKGSKSDQKTVSLEFYVRAFGAGDVFLAAGFHPPVVQPHSWTSRLLFPFEPDSLLAFQRLDFQSQESWTVEDLSSGPAQAWLRQFLQLQALSVEGIEASKPRSDSPFGLVTDAFRITFQDASVAELSLGGLDGEGRRFARVAGKPWLYTLAEADVASLRRARSLFP